MRFIIFLCILCLWALPCAAAPHALNATLTEAHSLLPLFEWQAQLSRQGRVMQTDYIYPGGKPCARETLVYKGDTLKRYTYTRYELDETASVTILSDTLLFTRTIAGKTKTKKRALRQPLVVGPLIPRFIHENLESLLSGKILTIYCAAPETLHSYAFVLKVDSQDPRTDADSIVITMELKNFLIRPLLEPMTYIYSRSKQTFTDIIGRTLPLDIQDGKTKAIYAQLRFQP